MKENISNYFQKKYNEKYLYRIFLPHNRHKLTRIIQKGSICLVFKPRPRTGPTLALTSIAMKYVLYFINFLHLNRLAVLR